MKLTAANVCAIYHSTCDGSLILPVKFLAMVVCGKISENFILTNNTRYTELSTHVHELTSSNHSTLSILAAFGKSNPSILYS